MGLAGATGRPRCLVAWSGGLDSTVLVHALRAAGRAVALRAVHVDHALQPAAADFRRFCVATARRWRVPLAVVRAEVHCGPGDSLEAAARDARRVALAAALQPGELLLTAQHADDQLETLLLALLRGAGPAGLAAMPPSMPFAGTRLLRPLLGFERAQLLAYARQHGLAWSEDPTNASARFDRNYLRSEVVPGLRRRWPAAARTIARSARHCAAAAAQLAAAAAIDLEAAADGADLDMAVLRRWPQARRAAVLRAWLHAAGERAPDERQLQQVEALMAARVDAHPSLQLPGFTVRRHDGRLMLERTATVRGVRGGVATPAAARAGWRWQRAPLALGDGAQLAIRPALHGDLDLGALPARLRVQFAPSRAGRALRKLLQELDIPQWRRARLPLLFAAGSQRSAARLLAVGDLWLDPAIRSAAGTVRRGRIFWHDTG